PAGSRRAAGRGCPPTTRSNRLERLVILLRHGRTARNNVTDSATTRIFSHDVLESSLTSPWMISEISITVSHSRPRASRTSSSSSATSNPSTPTAQQSRLSESVERYPSVVARVWHRSRRQGELMSTTGHRFTAARNDWRSLRPRALGTHADAPVSVTVVIPAHGCQPELDLALAALVAQSHPSELLDVIVVDDRSEPALELPELRPNKTELIRVDGGGHGSGHARDVGARQAHGDVVLFLDADIIADRHHVEAHARWHEVTSDAVVLGFRDLLDGSGGTAEPVHGPVRDDELDALFAGRPREPHSWIEQMLARPDDLAPDREDLWRAVVGASVSTSRRLYEEVGG